MEDLELGAHRVTLCRGYVHHGLYAGDGRGFVPIAVQSRIRVAQATGVEP